MTLPYYNITRRLKFFANKFRNESHIDDLVSNMIDYQMWKWVEEITWRINAHLVDYSDYLSMLCELSTLEKHLNQYLDDQLVENRAASCKIVMQSLSLFLTVHDADYSNSYKHQ